MALRRERRSQRQGGIDVFVTAKALREGACLPRWYGVAYFEPDSARHICYPIPFHWIMRIGRSLWWRFLLPQAKLKEQAKWESMRAAEFTAGYKAGREAEEYGQRRGMASLSGGKMD